MDESTPESFVADIAWICRGTAKNVPEKIEIEKEDLKELLQGEEKETSDEESLQGDEGTSMKQSLRGSASDLTEGLQKYKLDDYDDVNMLDEAKKGLSLKGLAYYTSPLEDPYITRHSDSDEEEDKEDFELKDSDNLVVVAKIIKEDASLEVYTYNEENDDWYLHHDYILDAPPLCLAPFNYDPGAEDKKGNLVAVGTMNSVIHVWDLDIVNAMEPVLSLGQSSLKNMKNSNKSNSSDNKNVAKKSRKKRDGSGQCHTDAVLCLDWNQLADHILASGSADQSVILWDLDEAKPATIIHDFDGMVQSLRWHPAEKSIILCGTRKGRITLTDCRSVDTQSSPLFWSIGQEFEVEKVLWDHFNPFCAFACSSDGKLRYIDTRKPGEFANEILAHDGGVNDVSQSFKVKGLLTTAGAEEFKVWKLGNDGRVKHVYTHQVNMGSVNIARFSPDSGNIMVVGAEIEELVRVFDLSKFSEIVSIFNQDDVPMKTNKTK